MDEKQGGEGVDELTELSRNFGVDYNYCFPETEDQCLSSKDVILKNEEYHSGLTLVNQLLFSGRFC
jgi:hypothetical protein